MFYWGDIMGKIININDNWKFHYGDTTEADYMGYNDDAWQNVTLPHDWSVSFPFDKSNASGTGYLPGGTGWYRKHFFLPDDIEGKRVRLNFDGVYKHSRVYVNSHHIGGRASGYSPFTFDISEFIRAGENVISVRVEHEQVADSRWFTGSGIYRDVTLEITEMSCFAENSIFVTTKEINGTDAVITVEYSTIDCDETELIIETKDGLHITATEGKNCGTAELTVKNASLWSPDSPYLYILRCHAFKDGKPTDTVSVPFGIRTIRFDADKGFFLNDINMKLKGVCVHHDAGTLGAAVPKEIWARRLRKFKESGCNALRTAHNPPCNTLLDLCDELGLLVMDEAFDEWEGTKNKWWQGHNVYPPKKYGYAEDFPLWHKADLEAMILRDRNHPSVILWSIGNEIDYPNDPYVTPLFDEVLGNNDNGKPKNERMYNNRKPDASRLTTIAKELVDIAHNVDTTRPVLSALSFPELSTRTGFADVLDVSGYNYRERFYEEDHKRFPDRVIFGSENGHDVPAWHAVRDNEYICGQFLWTGIDFLGECVGWPKRISQAGMLDLCAYEKPLFFIRKAMWSDEPFVKIAVSEGEADKTNVWTDNFIYSADEGTIIQVSCYTNRPEAEIFLNGTSLGKKKCENYKAKWEIPFTKGTLTAVVDGAEDYLSTPDKAEKISLTADRTEFNKNNNIIHVEVEIKDKNGNTAATDDKEIYYQLLGDAEILGIENGNPADLTPYSEKYRKTFRGRAIVYIRAGTVHDKITLFAYTKDGLNEQITFSRK